MTFKTVYRISMAMIFLLAALTKYSLGLGLGETSNRSGRNEYRSGRNALWAKPAVTVLLIGYFAYINL